MHIDGIAVQSAVHGKQAQGVARLFRFVDCARLKGHGDRIGLVGARIPKLAVHKNGDGHQRCLAIGRELKHGQRPRSCIFLLLRWRPLAGRDLRTIFLSCGQCGK